MNIKVLSDLGLEETQFDTGAVLIREGKASGVVYVMVSGKVDVRARDQQLAVLDDPGSILGEVSVLLGSTPVATITTLEPSEFYVITDFLAFIREHPDACVSVAQLLACRLVNTNNHLVYVKEQLQQLQAGLANYVPAFPESLQT